MNPQSGHKYEIIKNLDAVIRKNGFKQALKGVYLTLTGVFIIGVIFSLSELFSNFNSEIRTILFFSFILLSTVGIFVLVILPLLRGFKILSKPEYNKTASEVGNNYPDIRDELVNALQLTEENSPAVSKSLIHAAFERVYSKTKNIKFADTVNFKSTSKLLKILLFAFFLISALYFLSPGLRSSASRLMNFDKEFITPQKFTFEVIPGNVKLTKGENLAVKIKVIGEKPEQVYLATKSADETSFDFKELKEDAEGLFPYELTALRNSLDYYASAENINSEIYKVDIISRPNIGSFEVNVNPPKYSRLPAIVQKDNGNITALPGTRVKFDLSSSKELTDARIVFSNGNEKEMAVEGSDASTVFYVEKDSEYYISVTDTEGHKNINAITYMIKTLTDEFPRIAVVSPDKNENLPEDDRMPILLKVSDDYGFSKLLLKHRLSASRFEQPAEDFTELSIPFDRDKKESDVFYNWDLAPMFLATDDVISYYFELFDNDNISGPKSVKSDLFTLRVPTLDELFSQVENKQKDAEKDLLKTFEEAQKLNEEMEKLSNEMKRDEREITWEEKEKLEKAMQNFEELQNKVEDIKSNLKEMQQDLQSNDLLSEETLEKYMELQELLNEMTSEEFQKAMEEMRDKLENMMRDQAQKSLEDMKLNEEMFQKSIERTLSLLKRIQVEQKMDELVKRTEDITDKQEKAMDETSNKDLSDKEENEKLADQQQEISKNLENLQKEMEKLKELMDQLKDMPAEEMQKLMEEFQEQQNQEMSEETKQQISEQMKQEAMQNQQKLSKNMKSMMEQMKNMQSSMQMQNQMEVMSDMLKSIDNLLTLSKDQEELLELASKLPANSPRINEIAQDQSKIQSNLDKVIQQLSELSKKTFAISPELGKAIGQAKAAMMGAQSGMQDRNSTISKANQKKAMKSLNEAVTMMKGSMEQMMQGGQGGGMMSMMQQLQQMAQQQMGLNQLTQMLGQGQMGNEQMGQLQKLAQEQQLIQKSLEQLNKEAKESGQSKKLATNLEKILQDIQEVVSDMSTQKLNDELIQKQERILSRMLEAQRSINDRDFEKQREANKGTDFSLDPPPELLFSTDEGKDVIKDELLKAIREGYSKDYENLIRRYFESLRENK